MTDLPRLDVTDLADKLRATVECPSCAEGEGFVYCPECDERCCRCNGLGRVPALGPNDLPPIVVGEPLEGPCPECEGEGWRYWQGPRRIPELECPHCTDGVVPLVELPKVALVVKCDTEGFYCVAGREVGDNEYADLSGYPCGVCGGTGKRVVGWAYDGRLVVPAYTSDPAYRFPRWEPVKGDER